MGRWTLLVLLGLCILLVTVEGGRKNKKGGDESDAGKKKKGGKRKNKGEKGCTKKDENVFKGCLKKGFKSSLEGCKAADAKGKLKKKFARKCKNVEKKLKGCGFDCVEKPKPTEPKPKPTEPKPKPTEPKPKPTEPKPKPTEPKPKPTEPKPKPTKPKPKPKPTPGEIATKCAHERTNFGGADIYNAVYGSFEECAVDCLRTRDCKAITYRATDKRCYLKNKAGGLRGPTDYANHKSMNMECNREKVDLSCQREGINFGGAALAYTKVPDLEECVIFCRDTEDCVGFTFRESDNYCFLKSKRGGDRGPTVYAGHVSMNLECDNSEVKDMSCLRKGINFAGADLTNIKETDERECVKHCRDTEDCVGFTFRESDTRCFLKSKRGGVRGPSVVAGHNSMNMECDNSKVTNLNCLRDGINFWGADLVSLIAANEEECVRHCRDTEGCVALTFRESDKRCYLKNKRGGYNGPIVGAGLKSMNMECDNSPVTNLGCLIKGTNFAGADLRNLIVADVEECVRHCRDTEGCVALTFRESDKRCYLKSMRFGRSGPSAVAGHNSMNMQCDKSKVTNLNCLRDGINFYGADLRNYAGASVEDCVMDCRETEKCVSLTFRESDKRCFLKSKRGGLGPTVTAGHKSMNMECDNSGVTNLGCLRKGYDYPGADIRNLVVGEVEECVQLCRDTEGCVALTFRETDKRCWLKNKRGGVNGPTVSPTLMSMNMECDNSPVTNMDCLRKGFNFPGNDLRSLVVADIEECVRHCRDTEDCVGLSFLETSKRCYLKSKRGGSAGPIVQAGYSSMNLECDNSKPDLSCLKEDDEFPAHNIKRIVVEDLEQCNLFCRDTEDCQSLSFFQETKYCDLKRKQYDWWEEKSTSNVRSKNLEC